MWPADLATIGFSMRPLIIANAVFGHRIWIIVLNPLSGVIRYYYDVDPSPKRCHEHVKFFLLICRPSFERLGKLRRSTAAVCCCAQVNVAFITDVRSRFQISFSVTLTSTFSYYLCEQRVQLPYYWHSAASNGGGHCVGWSCVADGLVWSVSLTCLCCSRCSCYLIVVEPNRTIRTITLPILLLLQLLLSS